jgi:uncharacterized membrane protein YqjE
MGMFCCAFIIGAGGLRTLKHRQSSILHDDKKATHRIAFILGLAIVRRQFAMVCHEVVVHILLVIDGGDRIPQAPRLVCTVSWDLHGADT